MTVEQHLQLIIGQHVFQIASLQAQLVQAQDGLAEANAKISELQVRVEPDQAAGLTP